MAGSDFEFLSEEDIEDLTIKPKIGKSGDFDIRPFLNKKILFGYDYLDIDETEYSFSQVCMDNNDIIHYFRKVKMMSGMTIAQMQGGAHKSHHLHLYTRPNPKLIDLLKRITKKDHFKVEEMPIMGQVGLYQSEVLANRNSGVKCPRVYFMIGKWAVCNVLFFDPYHEINPGDK